MGHNERVWLSGETITWDYPGVRLSLGAIPLPENMFNVTPVLFLGGEHVLSVEGRGLQVLTPRSSQEDITNEVVCAIEQLCEYVENEPA
jgi:hypothetical protein